MNTATFNRWFGRSWLSLGYFFLYVPIVALVLYSFNDSPVPNVWQGFTLKWYGALASDRELLAGLWLSLKIAFVTACSSVVLGTLAAFGIVCFTVIWLRRTHPDIPRGYRVPLYPMLPVLGILSCFALIFTVPKGATISNAWIQFIGMREIFNK